MPKKSPFMVMYLMKVVQNTLNPQSFVIVEVVKHFSVGCSSINQNVHSLKKDGNTINARTL